MSQNCPGGLVNLDGNDIPSILEAVLQLLPLDETAPPAMVMGMMQEHKDAGWKTPIWQVYKKVRGLPIAVREKLATCVGT